MNNKYIIFIIFVLRFVTSSEDKYIIQRRAGGQSYLSNNLPSLFIKSFTKVVNWKGRIPIDDIRQNIDSPLYSGYGSATKGYLTADMSDMTLLEFTPWAYNPGKGVQASYTFRIPELKMNYDFESNTPCSMTGTLKAKLYKSKMTIYVFATKSKAGCEFYDHWDWTRFNLEPREYDYDLVNVDYSWYNWILVTAARTAIQGALYKEMGDTDSFMVKDLQKLLGKAFRSQVKEAFFMAVREAKNNGVDVCKEFLASY